MKTPKRKLRCDDCTSIGKGKIPKACDIERLMKKGSIGTDGKPRRPFPTDDEAFKEDCDRLGAAAAFGYEENPMVEAMLLANYGISPRTLQHDIMRVYNVDPDMGFPGGEGERANPASAVDMREVYRTGVGAMLMALRGYNDDDLRLFTLTLTKRKIEARNLLTTDPRGLLHWLREDLRKVGVKDIEGPLIAFLHCEFDPLTNRYQFFARGVGPKAKVEAMRKLEGQKGYASEGGGPVLDIQEIKDRVGDFADLFKMTWLNKGVRLDGDVWKKGCSDEGMPEPYFSLSSLWLSRQLPSALRLTMGCRFLECGHLKVRKPKKAGRKGRSVYFAALHDLKM